MISPAIDPQKLAEARANIDAAIRSMWVTLTAWFGGSIAAFLGLSWIAQKSRGPAVEIVYLLAAAPGIASLVFGMMWFSFFNEAAVARGNAEMLVRDPDAFMRIHRGIYRITWR